MMAKLNDRGNTLTEYGIILSCLAVLLIASFSLLGDATAGMLANIGKTITDERNALNSNNPSSLNQNAKSAGMNALATSSGAMGEQSEEGQNHQSAFPLGEMFNGATNVTSVDGDSVKAKVNENLKLLQQLKQVLAESNNPELQNWAEDALIRRMQWLTASEGYAAGMQDFQNTVPSTSKYSHDQAIQDTAAYPEELSQIIQGKAPIDWVSPKPTNVSPSTWKKISNIVAKVTDNAQALTQELAPTTSLAPKQLAWKATYNIIVPDVSVTESAIQNATSSGTLATNVKIADTANKSVELKNLDLFE